MTRWLIVATANTLFDAMQVAMQVRHES